MRGTAAHLGGVGANVGQLVEAPIPAQRLGVQPVEVYAWLLRCLPLRRPPLCERELCKPKGLPPSLTVATLIWLLQTGVRVQEESTHCGALAHEAMRGCGIGKQSTCGQTWRRHRPRRPSPPCLRQRV